MRNNTRRVMKRRRSDLQRAYTRLSRLPGGRTEGFYERWKRIGKYPIREAEIVDSISLLTVILERTKGDP